MKARQPFAHGIAIAGTAKRTQGGLDPVFPGKGDDALVKDVAFRLHSI
jgi:hypothetical protein